MNWLRQISWARVLLLASTVLVVLLVILVAIVPNSDADPEYVMRTKVSRIQSEMRSIASLLEGYFERHGAYPLSTINRLEGALITKSGNRTIPSFSYPRPENPATLTTPIEFITTYYPSDIFAEIRGQTFAYYAPGDGQSGWILFSPGPDGDFNLPWAAYETTYGSSQPRLLPFTYDPTNGAVSGGCV